MQEKILTLLKDKERDIHQLSIDLAINNSQDFVTLSREVNRLIEQNKIFEVDGIIYATSNYHKGTVSGKKGYLFVEGDEDYFISNSKDMALMNRDEIIYRIKKKQAECVKIIKRNTVYILGTMVSYRKGLYFFSDDYAFQDYVLIDQNKYQQQLKKGTRVRAYICDYQKQLIKIDTILGDCNDNETLIKTILLTNQAPGPFKNKVIQEANEFDQTIDFTNRKDLTNKSFVTIDGPDAKDYDDAIYVENCDDGYICFVAIADVSHYVKEDSLIDREAYNRGASIYYPGHVIPMLPEQLCNDLCSLKQNVNRYVITVEMEIDFTGEVTDYRIYPAVICSKHRMSYPEVNMILDHDKTMIKKYEDVTAMIYSAYQLSRIVDKKRKEIGGIEFASNEPVVVEENGKVVDIKINQQGKAELLIEDFMILANVTVAKHMYYLNLPMVYRNHDYPKPDKLARFIDTASSFGYHFKNCQSGYNSAVLQKCLSYFEGQQEYPLMSELLLQSMSKALYQSTNAGHYGLGLEHYCHFTSPIRRYPDLIVHRMLRKYVFELNNLEQIDGDNQSNTILVQKCNEAEKRATNIERSVIDLKCCQYMSDKIGEVFEGMICAVVAFGFYVQLANSIEGLVSIYSLHGDYQYDGSIISDGVKTYHVGKRVKVRLENVDLIRRNIDFKVLN